MGSGVGVGVGSGVGSGVGVAVGVGDGAGDGVAVSVRSGGGVSSGSLPDPLTRSRLLSVQDVRMTSIIRIALISVSLWRVVVDTRDVPGILNPLVPCALPMDSLVLPGVESLFQLGRVGW